MIHVPVDAATIDLRIPAPTQQPIAVEFEEESAVLTPECPSTPQKSCGQGCCFNKIVVKVVVLGLR